MGRFRGYGTDIYTEGRRNEALDKRITSLEDSRQASTSNLVTAPEPCTPDFALGYVIFKGQLRGQFCANIASNTARLKTVIIKDSDCGSQATYESERIEADNDVDDDSATAGHFEYRYGPALEANTLYRLIRLIGIDGQGGRQINEAPLYTDTPLATFTTTAAANTVSKPTLARIVANTTDGEGDGVVGVVTFRVFADETEVKTFAEQLLDTVQVKIRKASDDSKIKRNVSIDDNTVTFIDIVIGDFQVGREYEWVSNAGFNVGEIAVAPSTSTITFFAGGYADPNDGLANLTLVSYTGTADESGTQLLLDLALSQPNPPYRLKNGNLERSKSGGPFVDQNVNFGLQDPIYNTAGTIHFFRTVPVHPGRTYQYRETIKAVGGVTKQFTSGSIVASAATVAAQLSAQGGGPSLIVGSSLQASVKDDNDLNNPPGIAGDAIYPMRQWDTFTNSGTRIDNKASGAGGTFDTDGVRWDSANARLECATNIVTLSGAPAVRIGKILHANDVVVLCPSFLSNSADITADISFALVDQATGDMVVETATAFAISHTTPKRGLWILIVDSGYTTSGKQWVELRFGANPAQKIYTWNWQLDYGEVYRDYKVNGDEKAVLDFLDVAPLNVSLASTGVITESANGDLFSRDGNRAGPISLE